MAVADVNEQKTDERPLIDDEKTALLDQEGVLDSLAFALLIVTIEQYALDDHGLEIVLFDDQVMEMDFDSEDNPFRTIGTLRVFVAKKLALAEE